MCVCLYVKELISARGQELRFKHDWSVKRFDHPINYFIIIKSLINLKACLQQIG